MMEPILQAFEGTASAETLMEQAHQTAKVYMDHAVRCIDATFEDGYAKAHPELVAAFMQTAASDFASAIAFKASKQFVEALSDAIENAANRIGDALEDKI